MVYGFVKQSGGHMTIYSELGKGTTINLYLPEARSEAAIAAEPEASPEVPRGQERVLYVEDDDVVRDIVVKMLSLLGYQTTTASNGPQAIEILQGGQPIDLLFTDVVLPGGISGGQLAETGRRHRPSLKVLYTSGYTESAILHHGHLHPNALMLKKPFQIKTLADSIRQALDSGS